MHTSSTPQMELMFIILAMVIASLVFAKMESDTKEISASDNLKWIMILQMEE